MADNTKSNGVIPTILVTGDTVVDHHVYIGEQRTPADLGSKKRQTFEHVEFGGAAMIERLLRFPAEEPKPAWNVRFGLVKDEACYPHCFAIWEPYASPGAAKGAPTHWLAREAGYGSCCTACPEDDIGSKAAAAATAHDCSEEGAKPSPDADRCPARDPAAPDCADILVVDDSGTGYRDRPKSWPGCLDTEGRGPGWMVWKMSRNLHGGQLWPSVQRALKVESRLILLVSAADLQRAGLEVAVGLSWERSVLDIITGLKTTNLEPLKQCAHLIVSFPDAGALWIDRTDKDKPVARLVYDPVGGEGTPIAPNRPKAFGYQACLAAGVVWSVASAEAGQAPDLTDGLRRGLKARRLLFEEGHGPVGAQPPAGFPANRIREKALTPAPDRLTPFSDTTIPMSASPQWTIAQQDIAAPGPFYDTACSVALEGLRPLRSIPRLQIGGYTTIERNEIEAIRRLRRHVDEYVGRSAQKQPLSITVFGAPGAGKSFIVEQIAKGFLGDKVSFIECNLSQFSDEKDLQGAFHLVRDAVLGGATPVVFWDEFDSQEYRWLRLLLAPMQDGKFREGQIVHPIGKCIFIFAGGTSATFDGFGEPDDDADPAEAARQKRAWKMSKGPDFKSRIHAHLDVLGPNPRLRKKTAGAVEPDPTDACFPIRRALFLRGVWGLDTHKDRTFSERLVQGLLEVPCYCHGSRSLTRVLGGLAERGFPVQPEALPAAEDLDNDMAPIGYSRQLVEFVHGGDQAEGAQDEVRTKIEKRIDEFAALIHAAYMKLPLAVRSPEVTLAYDNLSLFLRESNRAAVRRILDVLATAGLRVVNPAEPGALELKGAQKHLESRIDDVAAKEHEGWCDFHLGRGWLPTNSQSDTKDTASVPPRHPALILWADLSEDNKDKDRKQVRIYVEIIYAVDFALAAD